MTDDKKHEDKRREKVSDEELEDVAGGFIKLGDIKGEAAKRNLGDIKGNATDPGFRGDGVTKA